MILEKPINSLIAEFISEMDSDQYVKKNTRWVIERFVNWMVRQRINVKQPRRADVIHYKAALITEGKTPKTVNRYLAPLRTFFKWLEEHGEYTNVAAGIKSPKDNRAFLRDYLNPAQIVRLLGIIPTNTLTGLRDYALINLMVCYGLRRCEVRRLTIADMYNTDKGVVFNIQRKGKKYKEPILIADEVYDTIERYLVARNRYTNTSPLFGNHSQHHTEQLSEVMVSAIVKRYLKLINNSRRLTCHSLRHSAAINLLKSGRSIYDVKTMLGHESTKTTEVYLRAIEAEQRFSNPAARDLVELYKNKQITAKIEQITT